MRVLLLGLLAGSATLSGCRSDGPDADEAGPVSVVVGNAPRVADRNVPALRALQNAVSSEADDLARRLIDALRLRPLNDDERRLVDSLERVLIGRELVRGLDFRLHVEPTERGPLLVLSIDSRLTTRVVLELPPADLEHVRVAIDEAGLEGRDFGAKLVGLFESLSVAAGTTTSCELGPCGGKLGRALAARDRWKLSLRAGRVRRADEEYPSGALPNPHCEVVAVSDELSADPVTPDDFASLVANALLEPSEEVGRELLPAAVRIPLDARAETLRRLAPVLRTFSEAPPRVGAMLGPSLRWLARTHAPGTDVAAWASWLTNWVRSEEDLARQKAADGLELPGPDSSSSPRRLDYRDERAGAANRLDLP